MHFPTTPCSTIIDWPWPLCLRYPKVFLLTQNIRPNGTRTASNPFPFHTGSDSHDLLPLRHVNFPWPFPQTVLRQIPHPALSTTAAFLTIQCRCGESVCMTPVLEDDQGRFPSIPLPTTAAFLAIQCRCGSAFSCRPILTTIHGRFTVRPSPQRQSFRRFGASAARPSLRRHFNWTLYAGFSRSIRPYHKPNDRL